MVELKPGEWIRVTANVKLQPRSWPTEPVSTRFRGEFWLRKNTFHPHPGGKFTQIQNLYPNHTPTKWLPVHLISPGSPGEANRKSWPTRCTPRVVVPGDHRRCP